MNRDSVREIKAAFVQHMDRLAGVGRLGRIFPPPFMVAGAVLGFVAGAAQTIPRRVPVGLGISGGRTPGDFRLGVRFKTHTAESDTLLERLNKAAHGELDARYTGSTFKLAAGGVPWHRTRQRPLRIGASVGHPAVTAGTLGFFAVHTPTGRMVIVSNNHVLADENRAGLGDAIVQAASADLGRLPDDAVARLFMTRPLTPTGNTIDAAIATLEPGAAFKAAYLGRFKQLAGLRDEPLEPGDKVKKIGRTTGPTHGVVTAVELDGYEFGYDTGLLAFDQQIEIEGVGDEPFSKAGDSGSLIIDRRSRASGLLFAGSSTGGSNGRGLTYANDIHLVSDAFDLQLALVDAGA